MSFPKKNHENFQELNPMETNKVVINNNGKKNLHIHNIVVFHFGETLVPIKKKNWKQMEACSCYTNMYNCIKLSHCLDINGRVDHTL